MGNSKIKPKGWHSKRHRTSEAQEISRDKYKEGRGPNMRKGKKRKK